jgi:2-keto-4-pentenoate hydratase
VADDLVVYNKATTPRLTALRSNPKVAFTLRGDLRARGVVTFEGVATVGGLPPALELPGYVGKYRSEIERLGWTPVSFSDDYSVGVRIIVTRTRTWGLDVLDR